jgi:hypothetical protein
MLTIYFSVPNCQDTELNNGETDVDCGGSNNCTRCATGDECFNGSDCQSLVCDDEFSVCCKYSSRHLFEIAPCLQS